MLKVQAPTTDPPDAEELTVWDAVLASLWVSWIVHKVVVCIRGFREEINDDPIVSYIDQSIQKAEFLSGDFMCELQVFRAQIQVLDET